MTRPRASLEAATEEPAARGLSPEQGGREGEDGAAEEHEGQVDEEPANPAAVVQGEIDWRGAPGSRMDHVAVFTGTHMVVWGGDDAYPSEADGYAPVPRHGIATGGRYDPRTDSWTPTATRGAPPGTYDSVAVWTGTEMVVWGGDRAERRPARTGGRYNPTSDRWVRTARRGAPGPRAKAAAVWTGTEMIVWGGRGRRGPVGDGARYDPAVDRWTPMTNDAAPSPRSGHSAIWTGSEMIVWGGLGPSGELGDGARYDPVADLWRPLPAAGTLGPRSDHVAVYTGEAMIVWGGHTGDSRAGSTVEFDDGALYSPVDDTWHDMSAKHAHPRPAVNGVWTGTHLAVLGGYTASLGLYEPASDTWTALDSFATYGQSLVVADGELLAWGGADDTNILSIGARIALPGQTLPSEYPGP